MTEEEIKYEKIVANFVYSFEYPSYNPPYLQLGHELRWPLIRVAILKLKELPRLPALDYVWNTIMKGYEKPYTEQNILLSYKCVSAAIEWYFKAEKVIERNQGFSLGINTAVKDAENSSVVTVFKRMADSMEKVVAYYIGKNPDFSFDEQLLAELKAYNAATIVHERKQLTFTEWVVKNGWDYVGDLDKKEYPRPMSSDDEGWPFISWYSKTIDKYSLTSLLREQYEKDKPYWTKEGF